MNKDIQIGLIWAGIIVGLSLGATILRQFGIIDQDTVIRSVAMNGIMIAYYGNRAPKLAEPNDVARRIARVSGWSFVLSGIIYASVWIFAPINTAVLVGCGAVLIGMMATAIYAYRLKTSLQAQL